MAGLKHDPLARRDEIHAFSLPDNMSNPKPDVYRSFAQLPTPTQVSADSPALLAHELKMHSSHSGQAARAIASDHGATECAMTANESNVELVGEQKRKMGSRKAGLEPALPHAPSAADSPDAPAQYHSDIQEESPRAEEAVARRQQETSNDSDLDAIAQLEKEANALLARARAAMKRAIAKKKAVDAEAQDVATATNNLRSQLWAERKILKEERDKRASLERSIDRYKKRLKEANAQVVKLQANLRKRQLKRRMYGNQSKAQAGTTLVREAGRFFAHCPKAQRWLQSLEKKGDHDDLEWGDFIAVVGCEPFRETLVRSVLDDTPFTASKPVCQDASVMVVGRSLSSMASVHKQIAARRGGSIKIYSQEMAIIALVTGHDPFMAGSEVLEEMGKTHPVLSLLMRDDFAWPALRRSKSPRDTVIDITDWNPLSPLTVMGYHTGKNCTNAAERHDRLEDIVEGVLKFPSGFSSKRKGEWGAPGTSKRIRKVALHLVQNLSLPGQSPHLGLAADHWKSDYAWLKKRYPKGGTGGWPRV